ncbi:unnamed protein product [Spirodela intermedia]|uniref:Amino acid transporter transmembrane domain-containing protein n=1 Tax=Spirodela intermedia TaxID=51605 RepID=A0A7I8JBI3_SPIIN|nr:unnamed protein product [Spirodela intermedia]CAA6667568.1 unnamed protein product [Spirodela intermedia]
MGTLVSESIDMEEGVEGTKQQHPQPQKLDAGALFVLRSEGTWLHSGYHLTTSIVAPALLSLPFAFGSLGWVAGVVCLTVGATVTFYSYTLLTLVLEHHSRHGRRHLRFRDLAHDVLGPRASKYYIGPIQFLVCYGAVIANILLGGQSLQSIYLMARSDGNGGGSTMKLYESVAIFGIVMLVLAQMPSFHSLRHINLISLVLCLAYSACATAGSIYAGYSSHAPAKDYSRPGNGEARLFRAFNAVAVIATSYGNGIIPEIQATVAPPVTGKMFKGLCLCYSIVVTTFFSVATSGYWAFGKQTTLVPRWLLLMANAFTLLQLSAVAVVYLQPTNEVLEGVLSDPERNQYSTRNVVPRLISRSISVAIATTIAAMLPFFGDINGVIGAFGFLPLDFVIPSVMYNLTFRPPKRGATFWVNTAIASVFSLVAVVASVAAVRQIALDAKDYRLFAEV